MDTQLNYNNLGITKNSRHRISKFSEVIKCSKLSEIVKYSDLMPRLHILQSFLYTKHKQLSELQFNKTAFVLFLSEINLVRVSF